jgi:hypothetical protein
VVPGNGLFFYPLSVFSDSYIKYLLDVNVKEDSEETKKYDANRKDIYESQLKEAADKLLTESEICFTEFGKEYPLSTKESSKSDEQLKEQISNYLKRNDTCLEMKRLEKYIEDLKEEYGMNTIVTQEYFYEQLGKATMAIIKVWDSESTAVLEQRLNTTALLAMEWNIDRLNLLEHVERAIASQYQLTQKDMEIVNVSLIIPSWTFYKVWPGNTWFNKKLMSHLRQSPVKRSNVEQYFGPNGILSRLIHSVFIAKNVQLKCTISNSLFKFLFEQNNKAVEFGPFVFDKVQYKAKDENHTEVILGNDHIQPFGFQSINM